MATISNWQKYRLLIWKAYVIEKRKKYAMIALFLIPLTFLILLLIIRSLYEFKEIPEQYFEPIDIETLTIYEKAINAVDEDLLQRKKPKQILVYAPQNPFYEKIVARAVEKLKLEGFEYCENNAELENVLMQGNYLAGVQFENGANIQEFPQHLQYALRFPSELRTSKHHLLQTWKTNVIYPIFDTMGPRNAADNDGGLPVGYVAEGFVPIQNALSSAYIELLTAQQVPQIKMQRYAYNAYTYDAYLMGVLRMEAFFVILIYVYPSMHIVKLITSEKEQEMREIMHILGIQQWLIWCVWFTISFLILFVIALMVTLMFKFPFYTKLAIMPATSWSVLLCLMLIYAITLTAFLLLISAFFNDAILAATVTAILCFATNMTFLIPTHDYVIHHLISKICSCFFVNTAIDVGLRVILEAERFQIGAHWTNITRAMSVYEEMALIYVYGIMLLASVVYIAMGLYVEAIATRKYGSTRKLYFPFEGLMPKKYEANTNILQEKSINTENVLRKSAKHWLRLIATRENNQRNIAFEHESLQDAAATTIGLQITEAELLKIDNLSINLHLNEVTVILGHNNLLKDTIFIALLKKLCRTKPLATFGVCAQENLLYKDMSIREHIVYYCKLRSNSDINLEIEKYLNYLHIPNIEHVPVKKLTYGIQRTLAICCALCANTKYVLIDAPTANMDPISKERIWQLLDAEKMGRIIIVITEDMHEADIIADRMAIMCNGQLQCFGNPFYLKQLYGAGSRLILEKTTTAIDTFTDVAQVTKFIQKYIPNIEKAEEFMAFKFTYRIPPGYSEKSLEMLQALQANAANLNIKILGIKSGNIDEVYMRVNQEYMQQQQQQNTENTTYTSQHKFNLLPQYAYAENHAFCQKFRAQFYKKYLLTRSNLLTLLLLILLPITFLAIVIINVRDVHYNMPLKALEMNFMPYYKEKAEVRIILEVEEDTLAKDTFEERLALAYENYVKTLNGLKQFQRIATDFSAFMLAARATETVQADTYYIAAATIKQNNTLIAWLNNKPLHTAALTLNLLQNALARAMHVAGGNISITVINQPLPYHENFEKTIREHGFHHNGIELAICFCLCFMSAFFGMMIIVERKTDAKKLQYISGISKLIYWLAIFLWDYMLFALVTGFIIVVILTLNMFIGTPIYGLEYQLPLLLLYGLGLMPRTYIISIYFNSPLMGYAGILVYNFFSGIIVFILLSALRIFLDAEHKPFIWFFRFYLEVNLIIGLRKATKAKATIIGTCAAELTHYQQKTITIIPAYSNCPVMSNDDERAERQEEADSHTITIEIIILVIAGIKFIIIFLLIQTKSHKKLYECCKRLCEKSKRLKAGNENENNTDVNADADEIKAERQAIKELQITDYTKYNVIVDQVSSSVAHIKKISFRVECAQAFCILGPTNAGKTLLIKLLVADLKPSEGNIYINGLNLAKKKRRIYEKIGYCSHKHALHETLTARETLRIHSLLRCIKPAHIAYIIIELANVLDFAQFLDIKIQYYNVALKRKLSIAIALLGNPLVLILDEPTRGLDLHSKIRIWQLLQDLCIAHEKSIVFATQSITECLAVCTHLAIMVLGEFKCFGTPQYLNEKYATGIQLHITMQRNANRRQRAALYNARIRNATTYPHIYNINAAAAAAANETIIVYEPAADAAAQIPAYFFDIVAFVQHYFPNASVHSEYRNFWTFNIPNEDATNCAQVFTQIERHRTKLAIEDIFVTQITLRQTFMHFARLGRQSRPSGIVQRGNVCGRWLTSKFDWLSPCCKRRRVVVEE